jgi:hypothetical protein
MFQRFYTIKTTVVRTITYLGPNYFDVRINGAAFDKAGDYG